MPIRFPEPRWPSELTEKGPREDPSILLGGAAEIASAPYRVLAVRLNPNTLAIDYLADLNEDIYADYGIEGTVDELTALDDIDKSVLVPIAGGHYVVWMLPFSAVGREWRYGDQVTLSGNAPGPAMLAGNGRGGNRR